MKTLKVAEWLWWDKMSEIHDYRYNFSWNIKRYEDGEVVNDDKRGHRDIHTVEANGPHKNSDDHEPIRASVRREAKRGIEAS